MACDCLAHSGTRLRNASVRCRINSLTLLSLAFLFSSFFIFFNVTIIWHVRQKKGSPTRSIFSKEPRFPHKKTEKEEHRNIFLSFVSSYAYSQLRDDFGLATLRGGSAFGPHLPKKWLGKMSTRGTLNMDADRWPETFWFAELLKDRLERAPVLLELRRQRFLHVQRVPESTGFGATPCLTLDSGLGRATAIFSFAWRLISGGEFYASLTWFPSWVRDLCGP